ncbi:MAG: DNA polymerase-3 subunit delta', partial [Lentimonas sp.]
MMQLSQALPEALRESRAVKVLERSLAQNRLGHGILLHGESPDQLEGIVRAIASALLE